LLVRCSRIPTSQKKRKLHAGSKEAVDQAESAVATDVEITLRVACLGGSSLDLKVKVPPRELVREVKRTIGLTGHSGQVAEWANCFRT
jgi:hypothetical protein